MIFIVDDSQALRDRLVSMLSEVEGIEVLRTIKREAPPTVVVMLTNHTHAQYREKCMNLGADYFLDKTRDLDKLTEIFQDLVSSSGLKG